MDEDIALAARDHHLDKPENIYTVVAKVADAISGARAGARKDTYEQYIARLEDLEKVAGDFPGIEKVYAIQAGREVRIFVTPNEVEITPLPLAKVLPVALNKNFIAREIKITVLRETKH
jgi:ribonuclease Y